MGEIIDARNHFDGANDEDSEFSREVPETSTLISLALNNRVRAYAGVVDHGGGYFGEELFVSVKHDCCLHIYQKGFKEHDHLFFWVMAQEISDEIDEYEQVNRLLDIYFQGSWSIDIDD